MDGYDKIDNVNIHPKLLWHWHWSKNTNLNFSIESYSNTPNLAQLNPIVQDIDIYQVSQGNPNLKNYQTTTIKLEEDTTMKRAYFQFGMKYVHNWNPIMEEKFWNTDKSLIISSFDNQKSMRSTELYTNFRIEPIKNWASVGGNILYKHFYSLGNNYKHSYNNLGFHINADIYHWGFDLQWQWHKPYNNFWGESQTGDESYNMLILDYRINKKCHVSSL